MVSLDISNFQFQAAPEKTGVGGQSSGRSSGESHVRILKVKDGEFVFRAGETPGGIYFLKAGAIKIITSKLLARGRVSNSDFINKLVGPGEYFGFKALIQGLSYPFYAKAMRASEVIVYPKEHLESLLNSGNPVARPLLMQMANDLESLERITQLHYLASVQERIAFQLVLLTEKFGVQTDLGISLNLRLSRNELAQLAGTINESLSRHLTELKTAEIIDLRGKEIIVKDLAKLRDLSGNFKHA